MDSGFTNEQDCICHPIPTDRCPVHGQEITDYFETVEILEREREIERCLPSGNFRGYVVLVHTETVNMNKKE